MRFRLVATATAIAAIATSAVGGSAIASPGRSAASPPAVRLGPYADVSLIGDYSNMENAIATEHLKAVTAGFIIAAAANGCEPAWNNDSVAVKDDTTVDGFIAAARKDGATVTPSFGGQSGTELALTCTNQKQLVAAYQSVVTHLKAKRIDFDIEGGAITDGASIKRRFTAIHTLESKNPTLSVSLTVPVTPTGLDGNGITLIKDAKKAHVAVSVFNIMAMDYDDGPMNMGKTAIAAAKATLAQVRSHYSAKAGWSNIGVTAQIGANTGSTTFTLANARKLAAFARSKHFAQLGFWSLDRDQQCSSPQPAPTYNCSGVTQSPYAFIKAFKG